jgi:putative Holliday junction resolvase
MAIVALDLGRRRIGIAVTDAADRGAHPLGALERHSVARDLDAVAAEFAGREVTRVIVGLPLNMNGSEGPAARMARAFAARLAAKLAIAVELFDERLTSFEAEERLGELRREGLAIRRDRRKGMVDAIAATVILEGWLEARDKPR